MVNVDSFLPIVTLHGVELTVEQQGDLHYEMGAGALVTEFDYANKQMRIFTTRVHWLIGTVQIYCHKHGLPCPTITTEGSAFVPAELDKIDAAVPSK